MATIIPTSQSTAATAATTTGVEAYEDMFKEITRKLYGDETGHGLHTLGTPIAHVATSGPTAPEGGERSFTTLMTDRSLIEYEHSGSDTNNQFKAEDHLTTAFGLAALMQNGFPPPGTILNPHSFPASTVTTKPSTTGAGGTDERWQGNEECLPWNTNKIVTNYQQQKPFKPKRELIETTSPTNSNNSNNQIDQKPIISGTNGNTQINNNNNTQVTQITKRYNCPNCPYSTDRRDLFTRHENIHKDEKPFHCYVCTKQFNRADHVKKHFLRMHRELAYDINKTRRTPSNSTKSTASTTATTTFFNQSPGAAQSNNNVSNNNSSITIPTTFQSSQHQTAQIPQQQIKQEKTGTEKTPKKKGEKRFVCVYCPWSGADSWGLKRHLNTHTKPYVCMLCDYKAARSERLATHVFKVHNKKACNKCNFLADDQVQFIAHQNEAHPHDATRPPRSSGSNNNVLRTIGNSFIQNNQLNNIQNTTTSGQNIFGANNSVSTNAAGNASNASGGANIYGNSTILSDVGNNQQNWNSSRGNSSVSQKRGAERLFQYMEADGSDPEDYARQMQMVALSRNTASVAQDFHNAGDGYNNNNNNNSNNKNTTPKVQANKNLIADLLLLKKEGTTMAVAVAAAAVAASMAATSPNNNSTVPINNVTSQLQVAVTNSSPANNSVTSSPSATTPLKKRHRLSHDKENTHHIDKKPKILSPLSQQQQQQQPPSNPIDYSGIERHMKDVITRFYLDQFAFHPSLPPASPPLPLSNDKQQQQQQQSKIAFDNFTSIHDYLKNNKELTISIEPPKARSKDSATRSSPSPPAETAPQTPESLRNGLANEKRNRKQAQPRKIEQDMTVDSTVVDRSQIISNLRDKHLIRLVEQKKFCKICVKNANLFTMPYHTKTSLILHMLWRHSHKQFRCRTCKAKFSQKYKLVLHKRVAHRNERAVIG